ncbi:MAG: histidine phosphatase family protein, partial [Chloroflexota bacterium]
FTGANDVPLSVDGLAHGSALATRLARYPLDAVYASSMRRAVETARFIATVHQMEVTPVPDLREMAHGVWDGMTRADVMAKWPEQVAAYDRDPYTFAPEGGESGEDVLRRAAPAMQALVRARPQQTIVVVAHKTTNRLLIAHFLGIDPRLYRDKLAQRPACLNVLDFHSETEAQLLLLNDIGHYAMTPSPDYPYAV